MCILVNQYTLYSAQLWSWTFSDLLSSFTRLIPTFRTLPWPLRAISIFRLDIRGISTDQDFSTTTPHPLPVCACVSYRKRALYVVLCVFCVSVFDTVSLYCLCMCVYACFRAQRALETPLIFAQTPDIQRSQSSHLQVARTTIREPQQNTRPQRAISHRNICRPLCTPMGTQRWTAQSLL